MPAIQSGMVKDAVLPTVAAVPTTSPGSALCYQLQQVMLLM